MTNVYEMEMYILCRFIDRLMFETFVYVYPHRSSPLRILVY